MNTETVAHCVTRGILPATGWRTEVWMVREADNTLRDRVTLYMYNGAWFAWTWTSDTINEAKVRERNALAKKRNETTDAPPDVIRLRAGSSTVRG